MYSKDSNKRTVFNNRITETRKNMNLPYSIRMFWTNFWQPTINAPQIIIF